ncbi:MAG: hypothetical protein HOU81_13405 [Hamadaea sp.]|uniref:DUF5667 domain-containing protein n=1 Tax=Hamadaea sp. TaxID=2024425 RepID=UPI00184F4966|nr:DUF5667 domain-containing protein [Hamadaea sp.]NUR71814.1 hypothetical protein [Hamadaea sp.]NUT19242.1 hypothetical protein [Hamadaea sp.]
MNTVFDRRRAERFARLLDEANGGRRHHSHARLDTQLAEFVTLGDQLRGTHVPGPTPDFRSSLRAQLMATAEREGIGVTATEPEPILVKPARSRTRIAIIAGVATGTLAVSGISMASGDANPGDALYQVKRSTERAQLALASSDLSRGQLYLEFARTRLGEASAVRSDGTGFTSALGDMDKDTVEGVRLLTTSAMGQSGAAALDMVDRFVTDQKSLMGQLTALVDGPSRQRAEASKALLDAISDRSHSLRAALACGAGTATADGLGPAAAPCPTPAGQQPETSIPRGTSTITPRPATAPSAGVSGEATTPAQIAPSSSATPKPSASTEGDEGLLGELGRILGDLLGN